jgi:hypothetical protein
LPNIETGQSNKPPAPLPSRDGPSLEFQASRAHAPAISGRGFCDQRDGSDFGPAYAGNHGDHSRSSSGRGDLG